MIRDAYKILKRPLVTEKTQNQKDDNNSVSFQVAKDANKIQIAQAVKAVYGVDVVSVHTMIMHGKVKRVGRNFGKLPNWKKAVVTLAEGDTIDFFEGV